MSISKKLVVNLSETLNGDLQEKLVKKTPKSSQLIERQLILYIEKQRKREFIENMKKGYKEMTAINVEMAEMGCIDDFKSLQEYEAWLTESDLPDDYDSEKRRYILC
ncbi:CopG family transcriptional regulator [Clostridium sp. 19966]|uniref:CopG family transcriptional regulator n=1 Tax=Clostridium sp. 19966 TaxID=2768166 RepID=UPI0028DF3664|nr:CopG family transcriptional regulator [Clostridium sp. 19966]MDT8716108.1 CopG family transcriptional regulator [Clostridium sp. 19966]